MVTAALLRQKGELPKVNQQAMKPCPVPEIPRTPEALTLIPQPQELANPKKNLNMPTSSVVRRAILNPNSQTLPQKALDNEDLNPTPKSPRRSSYKHP